MPFKGWGVVPLILNSVDTRPDSEEIRKELFTFLSKCRGHNNLSKLASYYDEDQSVEWPSRLRICGLDSRGSQEETQPNPQVGDNLVT